MMLAGAKKSGLDLSEQYLIDCGVQEGEEWARGCNGAHPMAYARWFPEQGGQMPHERYYPYAGEQDVSQRESKTIA